MDSNLIPFDFEGNRVRTMVDEAGQMWFVAKDVCEAIGLTNTSQVVDRLEVDEKGIYSIDTLGGIQELLFASESGMYEIVLGSRTTDRTRRFKRWVKREVLPSIRKTGSYFLKPKTTAEMFLLTAQQLVDIERRQDLLEKEQDRLKKEQAETKEDLLRLAVEVQGLPIQGDQKNHINKLIQAWGEKSGSKSGYSKAHRGFNEKFGLKNYYCLPQSRYDEAVTWLQSKLDSSRPLTNRLSM